MRILDLNEQDDVFAIDGKYVFNLDDLFVSEIDTTWRDSFGFLDSLSSVCTPLTYQLCEDEICTTMYTDIEKATIEDLNGDGTYQLVINTLEPYNQQLFFLKAYNAGKQELVTKFDITICGSEVISNTGETLTLTKIDSTNYG